MKSYFIVPVFNKEFLIADVYLGIVNSVTPGSDYKIIFIIDGCTDNSENIIRSYNNDNVIILHADDVHEILSLNMGLNYIKDNLDPQSGDLVFTVQDDVVLQQPSIDKAFEGLFKEYPDLGYVSMRLGATIHGNAEGIFESDLVESEFGHWKQLGMNHYSMVPYSAIVIKDIAVRSPTCMLWDRYAEAGFYDENLAPCGYDCHDMSIRMNKLGYRNAVFGLRYRSDVEWGGMRMNPDTKINSRFGDIYDRNRKYLVTKHSDYFEGKR